ncbi:sporulation peptidase YabG [Halolactibacillus alkaliphilus]|uniref:Sporulation peptidase YabG n=1 Tax=Halolactibacillus alkaliphilus TaxID=442899 RepID=A0A511X4M6_9BACI|nr:sporulation peptidase YabG [Halolactibacillus alkaliphilus]GEN57902.1 sporulation peptidase YabG [Halolactibacillus alkaliphilus]GGN75702.1 sporulation peptidase YabG [Halolactibacillus alkaliphilus]SFP08097.1 spore coat assemly protein [Halolactibacillus alkaliphilus]
MDIAVGDLITRKSYNHDTVFRVIDVSEAGVLLAGEDVRLIADASVCDVVKVDEALRVEMTEKSREAKDYAFRLFKQDYQLMKLKHTSRRINEERAFLLPAKVLHLDGDQNYLKKCIKVYQKLGIHVHGLYVKEQDMATVVGDLIEKISPDIVVITGHDSYSEKKGKPNELKAYRHTKDFVETVRAIRKIERHLDQLVIFAGACQSHFQSLIRAGANFASSPERVNIHALDPVYIAAKVCYTSFMDRVTPEDLIQHTLSKSEGIGGIETRGFFRTGMPLIEEPINDKTFTSSS